MFLISSFITAILIEIFSIKMILDGKIFKNNFENASEPEKLKSTLIWLSFLIAQITYFIIVIAWLFYAQTYTLAIILIVLSFIKIPIKNIIYHLLDHIISIILIIVYMT